MHCSGHETRSMAHSEKQYPIGPFEPPAAISAADRTRYLHHMQALPATVRTAVAGLSDARLDTPYRPAGWTVRQVVHHLADSHMNGYMRFRWTLTEDEPSIKTYDEEGWAEFDDARHMSVVPSLALLDALHARWVRLGRSLSKAMWERVYHHPESGRMTLEDALALYAWHGRHHAAHITMLREREGW